MNKKLLELLNAINAKKAEVKSLVEADKLDEAKTAKEELKAMQAKFDILKDMEDEAPVVDKATATPVSPAKPEKGGTADFANAVRNLPKAMMQEGGTDGSDGGYTVPEDVQTKINTYKEAHRSMRELVTVENVTTNKGSRTYQVKADVNGFVEVAENGKVPAMAEPKFTRVGYTIKDFAGYLPASNDLLADSDANIEAVIVDWIGKQSLATDNAQILSLIGAKTATDLKGLAGIKKAINVTLGAAYRGEAMIVTNDDGLNYLDTLEDANKRPLLNPDPTEDNAVRLRVGATTIPVDVFPNADMPSAPVYELTKDDAVVEGKTYYAYDSTDDVYTVVEDPEDESIATYYEITSYRAPFVLGDLKEAFHIYDRQQTHLFASNVASVTGYNAFEQRGTLFRADMRADYKTVDADAFVNGYITLPAEEE